MSRDCALASDLARAVMVGVSGVMVVLVFARVAATRTPLVRVIVSASGMMVVHVHIW